MEGVSQETLIQLFMFKEAFRELPTFYTSEIVVVFEQVSQKKGKPRCGVLRAREIWMRNFRAADREESPRVAVENATPSESIRTWLPGISGLSETLC